ncbi:MAG: hypothetical protein PHI93_12140 [Kiritimatiellae bacterium]|jgi:DNA-directed RNA polymerase specialized sigma24 family protein|nr:hypothetical protein [Kiritimatiellia bacterium]
MEIDDVLLTMCAGEDAEAEEAFTWLFHNYWEEVLRVLKVRGTICGLNLSEKETAVSKAFQELWGMARNGKIKDTGKDPRALLHIISLRRATDLVRRNTARKRHMTPEEWEGFVDQVKKDSSFNSQWRLLEIRGLAQEVIADYMTWMDQQKGVCRRTAMVMAEFLPDLATPKEIHEELCKNMNPPPTYESVKKAKTDVLNKFKAAIESKYEGLWKS